LAFAGVVAVLLTLVLGAARAEADSAQTFEQEFQFSLTSPCPPHELINVTFRLRFVVHEDGLHFTSHEIGRFKGESVTGIQYVGTGIENTAANGGFGETAATFTDEETVTYIAQGEPSEADDFVANHVIHVTFNPDGEITAQVFTEHTECR